jgi:ectoine hydroxylase-related dioxygenase (phytanoyl-CoA dioxygenase family)
MTPFAPPFNDSVHTDARLHRVIRGFLRGQFKMELGTVIQSLPGSSHQRWHQGWRYLWAEEERTPPYTVVVGVPLDDVDPEMGPTQFCPRRKLRFYHGWRCDPNEVVAGSSTLGTVLIFDYKTLHRGPANTSPKPRPMVSLVYSLMWFLNSYAFTNRALTPVAAMHQRRYWEAYVDHPDEESMLWKV